MIVSLFDGSDYNNVNCFYEDVHKMIYEVEDCIVKVGNKWRIKGNKTRYWNAEFDTKKAAQAALRAYWANKNKSN